MWEFDNCAELDYFFLKNEVFKTMTLLLLYWMSRYTDKAISKIKLSTAPNYITLSTFDNFWSLLIPPLLQSLITEQFSWT